MDAMANAPEAPSAQDIGFGETISTFARVGLLSFGGPTAQIALMHRVAGITAAVVGVVLNLAIWFALHVFFHDVTLHQAGPLQLWIPTLSSIDWRVVALAALSGYLLLSCHWSIPATLTIASASVLAWIAISDFAAPAFASPQTKNGALTLEATIPLNGVSGRIDHLAFNGKSRRLYVAELGNDTVDVIDIDRRQVIRRISGLHEPQGIGVSAGLLSIANAGDGTVLFYHSDDLTPAGSLTLGDDADNVRVDNKTGHIVVGYGHGALAVIDPLTHAKIAQINLPAHPEGFQFARSSDQAFINVPDANQIAVVSGGRQVSSWHVPGDRDNFPLALNTAADTAAVVFRNPPRLALIDTKDGAARANLETCADADDVFFDERRNRIYVSCGAGVVDIFANGKVAPKRVARVSTQQGARTSLFVPEVDRLFVAARGGWFTSAKILVYRPQG